MQKINNHLFGNIEITIDTELSGMISGSVIVKSPNSFYAIGMINGSVVIEDNAKMVLNGTVNGDIINEGFCEIYGRVNGKIIGPSNKFKIDKDAIVTL